MILECLVTTQDLAGQTNVAPMGPRFAADFNWLEPAGTDFVLRPYEPSQTLNNLLATGAGVLNFTDDVLLFAHSALKTATRPQPTLLPARQVAGHGLRDAAAWWEFVVQSTQAVGPRWEVACRVVQVTQHRNLIAFNRAMHAVIEATILATRVELLPAADLREQLLRLEPLIEKTAGQQQLAAWHWVLDWLAHRGLTLRDPALEVAAPPGSSSPSSSSPRPTAEESV